MTALTTTAPAAPGPLRAGAATADITPSRLDRTFLAGFGLDRRAEGVLERLGAACLHLARDHENVTLVSLDLIGLPRTWVEKIRARMRGPADPSRLLCCATHTHAGPDTIGLWGRALLGPVPRSSGVDLTYMEELVERVADCVDRASRSVGPATLRAASFEVPAHWTRNDRRNGARYDEAVGLAVDDPQGRRIATLLGYASHPETLWKRNRRVSPDFPGAFRRRSAQLAGGVPLYVSGPLGAMLTPNVPEAADLEERRTYAERLGAFLAEQAEKELGRAPTQPDPRLHHAVRAVSLPNHNWRFRLLQRIGWLAGSAPGRNLEAEVHHLRLGDAEVLSAPGEVAPEVGQRIRATMRAPHRLLLGLCNDEVGYVLEPAMFDDPEYRYEVTMSLGRETAETLMQAYRALVVEGG